MRLPIVKMIVLMNVIHMVTLNSDKTFNWKLAIGTHLITVAATVKYFKSERRCNAVVIVLAYDRYNFSSGIKFAGLIPGNWNGELVTSGLAQNYTSFGLYITSISWR